ncbi:DUF6457 domain-containing protein [Curtobacterium sp. 22159]|uniref:DUF6457 domain-containing protein n=1 Tax=Curtobacterium sp. 22159 TaxID=3453882 RepID=UPI003F82C8AF
MTDPSTLDDWTARLQAALGLEDAPVDVAAVLDLARDAAHGVARPAAPLTAYVVGIAVGRGMPLDAALDVVARTLPDEGS